MKLLRWVKRIAKLPEALDRIESAQQQAEQAAARLLAELAGRLYRVESAQQQAEQRIAKLPEALDRIESAQQQAEQAAARLLAELAGRLYRVETMLPTDAASAHALHADRRRRGRSALGPERAPIITVIEGRLALSRFTAEEADALIQIDPALAEAPFVLRDDRAAPLLPDTIEEAAFFFAAARGSIAAGWPIVWLLPPDDAGAFEDAELRQAIGIAGCPVSVRRSVGSARVTLVVARRRDEWLIPILRWTAAALADERFQHLPTAGCFPAVALEAAETPFDADAWARQVAESLAQRHPTSGLCGSRAWGIVWPLAALGAPDEYLSRGHALQKAMDAAGFRLVFQWVDGVPTVSSAARIRELAKRLGVGLDFTPTVREQTAAAFAAYDDLSPYRPMAFDLRVPSYAAADAAADDLVCIARQETLLVPLEQSPFDRVAQGRAYRLARVLDRQRVLQFRVGVQRGAPPAGAWEQWIVYNWKEPEPFWVRAVVFEPDQAASVLAQLPAVAGAIDLAGERLRSLSATAWKSQTYLDTQRANHRYLAGGRPQPSEDSLRLASWLPDTLGDTLEIGCGFGVLAQTFIHRTRRYVGIDLTVEQAQAVSALGGLGLVADMHALPFGDHSFDHVVADNAVEHAVDPLRALRELRRVLRPGGRAFLVVPLDYYGAEYRNAVHFWKADERSVVAACTEAGLRVVRHEVCVLPEIGAYGSFPACDQRTSLWELAPAAPEQPSTSAPTSIRLDWRAMLRSLHTEAAAAAEAVTDEILALNASSDLQPLARRSPSLRSFDWTNYLRLSQIRIVRAVRLLQRRCPRGRVLDLGAYFGNFALTFNRLGYEVTAVDSYSDYSPAFDAHVEHMRAQGVRVADTAHVGQDLGGLAAESFDAVLCMGVIEHVPHTPRPLLAAIDRMLRPGGTLLLDTPNLAYEYRRRQLLAGQTIFAPIADQFETEIPFEGHHREYTMAELEWMMQRIGYRGLEIETFNYSIYGHAELTGEDAACWRVMEADPHRRELILLAASKPA